MQVISLSTTVQCTLCPKGCRLKEKQRGDCRVRENRGGKLVSLVYGKPCAVHVDPIEKKPLFHVLPGSRSFSIATAGCNLHCKFCQNWEISQKSPEETRNIDMPPEAVVGFAQRENCSTIAYTYSESIVFYEYVIDTSKLARQKNIRNVLVTAGYINKDPLRELCSVADAANVDLKSFEDSYYRKVCSGTLKPVLDGLCIMKEEGVFVEITNLIVPTLNDDMDQIKKMCVWIKRNLGEDTPVHFSRFYPVYRLRNLPLTPVETLQEARETAMSAGLRYVYIGNVPGSSGENTVCPGCKKTVIERKGYMVLQMAVENGTCRYCGHAISGIWS